MKEHWVDTFGVVVWWAPTKFFELLETLFTPPAERSWVV